MNFVDLTFLLYLINASHQCDVLESGVTSDDENIIVDTHNFLRNQVAIGNVSGQPQASNMILMQYDSNLAKLAQEHANDCKFEHNQPKDARWFAVGQNLAETIASFNAPKDFKGAINAWFNEVSDPGYHPNPQSTNGGYTFQFDEGTGHYTQVVWATSNFVGCGYVKFNSAGSIKLLYVCNYGPAGNVEGFPIYMIGQPASNCSNNASPDSKFSGLCSS